MFNKNNESLFIMSIIGILLTSIYTAILASQLMSTKRKVNYLYIKEKFTENKN
jgi:hypothetical protein